MRKYILLILLSFILLSCARIFQNDSVIIIDNKYIEIEVTQVYYDGFIYVNIENISEVVIKSISYSIDGMPYYITGAFGNVTKIFLCRVFRTGETISISIDDIIFYP